MQTVLTGAWATTSASNSIYGFQGGRTDLSTGLIHFGDSGRDLDPNTGTWREQDNEYTDGVDLYQFELSSPAYGLDPSGTTDLPDYIALAQQVAIDGPNWEILLPELIAQRDKAYSENKLTPEQYQASTDLIILEAKRRERWSADVKCGLIKDSVPGRDKQFYENARLFWHKMAVIEGEYGSGGSKTGRPAVGAAINVPIGPGGSGSLRQAYVNEVEALADVGKNALASGKSEEEVARMLYQLRRDLGVKYKCLTPADKLAEITARNTKIYGDPLGPSIEYLIAKGKSWKDIIQSAATAGGKDLGL